MIARSDAVGYIHEPFDINRGPGICRTRFPYWFTYIRPGTDGDDWPTTSVACSAFTSWISPP